MGDGDWELFIAYPALERAAADELYEELVRGGASVFVDHVCLDAGDVWPAAIAAAQDAARVTVVLVSKRSTAAFFAHEEIQRGLALMRKDPARHRVVPVFLNDDADPPYGLHQIERLSRSAAGGMAGVARQLLAIVGRPGGLAPPSVDVAQHPRKPRSASVRTMFRRGLPRWLLLIALLLAVAAGGLAAAIWSGDQPAGAATIKIGEVTKHNPDAPIGVGVVGKDVVVLSYDRLLRIDANHNALAGELWNPEYPGQSMAVGSEAVWVTTSEEDRMVRVFKLTPINAGVASAHELIKARRANKSTRTGVSIDARNAWVIDGTQTVRAFDRATDAISHVAVLSAPADVGQKVLPQAVFAGERSVWVAAQAGSRTLVYRIKRSASRRLIAAPAPYEGPPGDLAVVESHACAWVTNSSVSAVTRLDAQTGKLIGQPTPVGSIPLAITAGLGAVWVTSAASQSVTRIDPASGDTVGAAIRVGPQPTAIAVGAGAIWVTSKGTHAEQSHNVIRIQPTSHGR